VPPWNFPIAIPCGGVAAALAAGNTVILKPASDTVLVAWELCQCFWRGGISRKTLQFAPCPGQEVGSKLVAHDDVDAVILTGGTATALSMLRSKPEMNLLGETGGKNATVVTALSDREQAIQHVVDSAFGHSGQKCSATSLLILEEEVYDDPRFKATLCDAVKSMPVGSSWKLENKMGPLIRPPSGDLEKGLKELEVGESWAVLPRRLEENPQLYSPGVKWGVRPRSYTHLTEFFGPVLGVMKARDLREALRLVNGTGYGLTSGLESLDDREQQEWLEAVRAGNLYINRVTTGAIVLRQPFGGFGKSAFGPGIKAGGPNYVAQLMDIEETGPPEGSEEIADGPLDALRHELEDGQASSGVIAAEDAARIRAAIASYDLNVRREFAATHDHFLLVGQDNLRRYLPVGDVRVRVHADDSAFDILARVCAARAVGCRTTVSLPPGMESSVVTWLERHSEPWGASLEFLEETDEDLARSIRSKQTDRVRYASPERVPRQVFEAVGESGIFIARAPILMEGRVELLWYVQEQSVSIDYHRHGNLGSRAGEERADVM
jgi:RHH-type proline utilization regulon transcriptional repressor/proline dehydrogenase/delta 1-pyrroline-5-carboxylate dehydrogenase